MQQALYVLCMNCSLLKWCYYVALLNSRQRRIKAVGKVPFLHAYTS